MRCRPSRGGCGSADGTDRLRNLQIVAQRVGDAFHQRADEVRPRLAVIKPEEYALRVAIPNRRAFPARYGRNTTPSLPAAICSARRSRKAKEDPPSRAPSDISKSANSRSNHLKAPPPPVVPPCGHHGSGRHQSPVSGAESRNIDRCRCSCRLPGRLAPAFAPRGEPPRRACCKLRLAPPRQRAFPQEAPLGAPPVRSRGR